jgi:hypothetical protein
MESFHMNAFRRLLSLVICLLVLGLGSPAHASTSYYIHLQAQSGHYVVAESGGNDLLYVNRTSPGSWETFELIDVYDSGLFSGVEVRLRMASNGRDVGVSVGGSLGWYTCGGAGTYSHTFGSSQNCRTFYMYEVDGDNNILWDSLIENGDQVAIFTYDAWLLSAEWGGGGNLTVDRWQIGPWERFFITM